jgi:hypothetical protein
MPTDALNLFRDAALETKELGFKVGLYKVEYPVYPSREIAWLESLNL